MAEVFIILEWLFGKTSDFYDEGKGSFRFPVLLIIEKTNGTFSYLMVISEIKLFYENYDNTVDLPDVSELIKEITADEE